MADLEIPVSNIAGIKRNKKPFCITFDGFITKSDYDSFTAFKLKLWLKLKFRPRSITMLHITYIYKLLKDYKNSYKKYLLVTLCGIVH